MRTRRDSDGGRRLIECVKQCEVAARNLRKSLGSGRWVGGDETAHALDDMEAIVKRVRCRMILNNENPDAGTETSVSDNAPQHRPRPRAKRRTVCKNGHPLTPENVYIGTKDRGAQQYRACRTCLNLRNERWRKSKQDMKRKQEPIHFAVAS